jgi:hypothetical protein
MQHSKNYINKPTPIQGLTVPHVSDQVGWGAIFSNTDHPETVVEAA